MSKFDVIKDDKIKNALTNIEYNSFEDFYNHIHEVHFLIHDNKESFNVAKTVFEWMIEEQRVLEKAIIDYFREAP